MTDPATGPGVALDVRCPDQAAYDEAVTELVDDRFASRIADQDPTLWGEPAEPEAAKRLEAIGTPEASALLGKAAVANAIAAYAAFEEVHASERWTALAGAGANAQRPLWASTGVKNPAYPDTLYVTDLVVADTVNTMPEKTMEAFADHGEVKGDVVTGKGAEAAAVFESLRSVGVDLDDVFLVLETEGVDKFKASWTELVDTVVAQIEAVKQ